MRPKDIEDALAQQYGYSHLVVGSNSLPAKVVAAFNPNSPFVEALRGLRSQLMLRWFDGSPGQTSLAITSVDRGDGKSFITANLGVVFAQLGERTLVIDADLRHPTQNEIFGLHNKMGLSGVLGRPRGHGRTWSRCRTSAICRFCLPALCPLIRRNCWAARNLPTC